MFRLLNIEFHKMRYSRATKILLIIYFSLFFSLTLFSSIQFKFGNIDFQLADQGIYNFPYIWHFNSYFAAFLKIFLALVIISMISMEFSNQTLKQNLVDGLSKREFILSKFYAILVFSVASTLLLFIVSLILGLNFSERTDSAAIFSQMEYLGGYFLKLTAFFSFCLFLGTLIKRSAFAIGALFVWWIFENIIKAVVYMRIQSLATKKQIIGLLPLESMSNLVKEPLSKLGFVRTTVGKMDTSLYWYQAVIAIMWTAIFVYGSYLLIKKRDL